MFKLTEIRKVKGLSISRLAQKARMNPADLSRLEAGKIFAYPAWRKRLAKALKTPQELLFEEVNNDRE